MDSCIASATVKISHKVLPPLWESFGGLCTVAIASAQLKRIYHRAKINGEFYEHVVKRLADEINTAR